MKTKMTSYKVYGAWEYDREISDLNRLSKEGWQLEKGGCFHSKFVRNENVRYLYQLDYAPNLEDKERYLSFFREQGWEYINSTYNGWHYFRRDYQENIAYENAEIYTDKESLLEMQGRYYKILRCFAILFSILSAVCVFHMVIEQSIKMLNIAICDVSCALMMWLVVINIKRRQNGQKELIPIKGQVFIAIWIAILICEFVVTFIF